ncbi:glycosyl hydrolase [Dyella choica]|nr:glycosyl hydrolase [Dyella choica]
MKETQTRITHEANQNAGAGYMLRRIGTFLRPLAFAVPMALFAAGSPAAENISVNYASVVRTLDPLAVGGADESAYGAPYVLVNDTLQQNRLQLLGVPYMRINLKYSTPGNPNSRIVCGAAGCDSRWSGDDWVNHIKAIGAEPVVEDPTNPSDLPNLVKHFNVDTNNVVHRWLGGINEPNIHGQNAATYSAAFNVTYDAMKKVDQTILIGGPTIAWYDSGYLQTFLNVSGSRVDFLDFHGYAQGSTQHSYGVLFGKAQAYETDILDLYKRIQATVPSRASAISIEVGEWDLDYIGHLLQYTPFETAWGASAMGHILKAGGIGMLYADKGNLLLKTGAEVPNGKMDDPTSMYHALGMYTGEGLFPRFGTKLVQSTTSLPNVEVYASDNPKNIVVINKDPSLYQAASIALNGVDAGTAVVWRRDQSSSSSANPVNLGSVNIVNGTFSYSLPPFSVTTFVIEPSSTSATKP